MAGTHPAVAALRTPAFRRYVLGQLPSVTCSWAQVVALSWVVVRLDPGALGWVVALQYAPSLLLGPWLGALVDRYDRRRLLMLAESGLGLVAAGFAVAAFAGVLTLPYVFALAAVWGVINALDTPARRALGADAPPARAGVDLVRPHRDRHAARDERRLRARRGAGRVGRTDGRVLRQRCVVLRGCRCPVDDSDRPVAQDRPGCRSGPRRAAVRLADAGAAYGDAHDRRRRHVRVHRPSVRADLRRRLAPAAALGWSGSRSRPWPRRACSAR